MENNLNTLTKRELEVLKEITKGKSNKEIGLALGVCTKTIETYKMTMMQKLNLHKSTHLIIYALKKGIVTVGELVIPNE